MPYVAGPKIAGRHGTVIDAALPVIEAIGKLDNVRIRPGIIRQIKSHGRRRLRFTERQSGLLIKVIGNATTQEIEVYTGDKKLAKEVAEKAFNPHHQPKSMPA